MSDLPNVDPLAIAESVAAGFSTQPELFGGAAFSPAELELVRVARSGRYNGARTRDEGRVAVVVALAQLGCSQREIQRRTGMDTRLVRVVLEQAERAGVVPALKEAVQRRAAELGEQALEVLRDVLDQGVGADPQLLRSIGVVSGILLDKAAGAAGAAGAQHLHFHQAPGGADPAAEYFRMRAAALSTECEAAAPGPKPQQNAASGSVAVGLAAPPVVDVESEPVQDPVQNGAPEAPAPPPGGGVGGADAAET